MGCNFAANVSAFVTLGISQLTSLLANVSFTKSDGLHECSLNKGYINIYPRSSNQVGIDYYIPDVLGGAQYGCYTSEDNSLVVDKDILPPTHVKLIAPSSKMTYSVTLDS